MTDEPNFHVKLYTNNIIGEKRDWKCHNYTIDHKERYLIIFPDREGVRIITIFLSDRDIVSAERLKDWKDVRMDIEAAQKESNPEADGNEA